MARNKRINLVVDTNLEKLMDKLKKVLEEVGGDFRYGETIGGIKYFAIGEGMLFADWKQLWFESADNGFEVPDYVPVILSSYHLEHNPIEKSARYILKCRSYIAAQTESAISNSRQKAKATFAEKERNKTRAGERKEVRQQQRAECRDKFETLPSRKVNVLRAWLQNDRDWIDYNICPMFNVIRRMGGGLVGLHLLIPRFKGLKVALIVGDISIETKQAVERWLEQKDNRRFIHVQMPDSNEFGDEMHNFCKRVCDEIRKLKPIDNAKKGDETT